MAEPEIIPVRDDIGDLSKSRSFFKKTGWLIFGIASFLFFTLAKFPEAKIKSFIQAEMNSQLSRMGIQLSSAESDLSLIFGVGYHMKDVRLFFPKSNRPLQIENLTFSPSLSSFLFGNMGGSASINMGNGEIDLSFSGDQKGKSMDVSFDFVNVDLGKAKVLESMTPVRGGLILNGSGEFDGSPRDFTKMRGNFKIKVSDIKIPPQKLVIPGLFFSPEIPSLVQVKEGEFRGTLKKGRLTLSRATIGNSKGKGSDLYLNSSGDIQLNRYLNQSTVDLKVQFALFGELQKSFGLLDTLLKAFKKSDGTFSYKLKGPISRPVASPN